MKQLNAPTPFSARASHWLNGEHYVAIVDAENYVICHAPQVIAHEIIQVCNSHGRLVAALENLLARAEIGLDQSPTHDGLTNCRAIAKARGALEAAQEVQS